MQPHKVVSYEEWLVARKAHLRNEKALTRLRDIVAAERRALPWVKVTKNYVFDTADGKKTLADLFGDNSQLIVHHFMWRHDLDSGCPSCSLNADHAEGALVHLINHDVSYVHVARAPIGKLIAYGQRLGWKAAVGLVAQQRLQFRLSRLVHQGRARERLDLLQFRGQRGRREPRERRAAGHERVLQGRAPATCITPTRPTRAATKR